MEDTLLDKSVLSSRTAYVNIFFDFNLLILPGRIAEYFHPFECVSEQEKMKEAGQGILC